MVLYKRKPIVLPDPRPLPTDLNIYVWHIDETGEWFITYEEYLERLDFYTRHHFTCEITGTSCLTFFQALDSEETEFKYVEERFPLKLREPVARFLHFNGIKRLDALVEQVYARFKSDFFPGEVIFLRKNTKDVSAGSSHQASPQPEDMTNKENGDTTHVQYQRPYIIKEKAQFNASRDPNTGEIITPAHAKYMLIEGTQGNKSLIADQSQLYRDRTTFTKHLIKCFCKITLKRASTKMGAPWAVKEEYLPMYGLTMEWPSEMLKYKDDESTINKHDGFKGKRKRDDEGESLYSEDDDHKKIDEDRKIGNEENISSSKRKRTAEDEKEDSIAQEKTLQVNVVTSIVEDLILPYQGPPHIFENLHHYNNLLEIVPVHDKNKTPFKSFRETQKLLQTFQFLSTFAPKMYLSYFNLDQLVTSLKCTDPSELKGEIVYVELLDDSGESSFSKKESDWERNPKIREFIKQRDTKRIRHYIAKDDPASEEIIDNINHNGCGLIIECISGLLRLFINEDGDWTSLVVEEWLDNNEVNDQENLKSGDGIENEENEGNEENELDDINDTLEKCLNYRNIGWAERLSKRQFNNHNWILILLGIFQDCMHIPIYTEVIRVLVGKLVPIEISATQLPKQLWRNFCFRLSLEEKLNCIWILVDLLSNFSVDVKTAVEESMDLCAQIRSERFRFAKDLKAETSYLNLLNLDLQALEQAGNSDESAIASHTSRIAIQLDKIGKIQEDKNFLDKQLMENDLQRLRVLGLDRYGNRYYWMDLCGVPLGNLEERNVGDLSYHSGRLWIQGPAADAAKFFLQISNEELNQWKKSAEENGKAHATKEVFHVYKTFDGAYKYIENDDEVELCDNNGIVNSSIELSSIQKKIIDETPDCLLLTDDEWYSVEGVEDVRRLIDWFDNWGRREHDLLKQFKTIEETLGIIYSIRDRVLHLFMYDEEEERLFKELQEYQFTEAELNLDTHSALDESDVRKNDNNKNDIENGDKENNGEEDSVEQNEEKDEIELEKIAEKIMKLDDSSKTRKNLNSIKELENRRDELLAKRQATNVDNTNFKEVGGNRTRARGRKSLRNMRNKKLNKQAEILTDLLNHRHFLKMQDAINWKNMLSTKILGAALRKNASGKQKIKTIETVDAKLKEIMDHTSRTTAAASTG